MRDWVTPMSKFLGYVFLFIVVAIIGAIVTAWPFMIAIGNLHAVWPAIPALGFLATMSVTVPLSFGVAIMRLDTSRD